MPELDRDTLKAAGWGLGKCFTDISASSLTNQISSDKCKRDVFIAITHDCSVIAPSLASEPYLEYLALEEIGEGNGQFTNARNIRKLHIEIEVDGESRWYEASMGNRGFIDRGPLEQSCPDNRFKLSADNLVILKRWLANRYISQTFPDQFNRLTGHLVKNSKAPLIKVFNSQVGKACHSIFISLTPDNRDLAANESYKTVIVLLFRDYIAEEIGMDMIDKFEEDVKLILEAVERLSPLEVYAMAESDASYSEIAKMSRWQLDYVSLKDGAEVLTVNHS
jgi:hypothetical protein